MRRSFLLLSILTCLVLSGGNASAKDDVTQRETPVPASEQIPHSDFVRPELFHAPNLNPVGTHFAALTKNENQEDRVLICEIATAKTWYTKNDIRSFSWISNTHLLVNGQMVIDISNTKKILRMSDVIPDQKRGLRRDSGYFSSYPPRFMPGNSQPPEPPEMRQSHYWALPENGHEGFCIVRSDRDTKRHLYRFENKEWKACPVNLDEITPIAPTDLPGEMYVLAPVLDGKPRAIRKFDTSTGTLRELIYQDPAYDCGPNIIFKRGTTEISGISLPQSLHGWIWLSESKRNAQDLAAKRFPGSSAVIVSSDITDSRFIIEVSSDRQPPIYYFLDCAKQAVELIKNGAPWIDPTRMRPMQLISYGARDGSTIEGFLVLPESTDPKHPAPLIVQLHEGPWSSGNFWGWDASTQLWASRGYAVFKPNYRGSQGYDSRFTSRDRFDFQTMSNDVTDGVRSLIKDGLVDPKRIAIGGVGFGGYLALCGVIDESDLYRCAYTYGGIFDWEKAFKVKDSSTLYTHRWLQQKLKDYEITPPSPLKRAAEIRTPVFFTRNVGVGDITYQSQTQELYLALRRRVECVNFGDLNLVRENDAYLDRVERYAELEKFFAKQLAAR